MWPVMCDHWINPSWPWCDQWCVTVDTKTHFARGHRQPTSAVFPLNIIIAAEETSWKSCPSGLIQPLTPQLPHPTPSFLFSFCCCWLPAPVPNYTPLSCCLRGLAGLRVWLFNLYICFSIFLPLKKTHPPSKIHGQCKALCKTEVHCSACDFSHRFILLH